MPPASQIPHPQAMPPASQDSHHHARSPTPRTPQPDTHVHREGLTKEFLGITLAGTLIASVQGQLLSTTITTTGHAENVAFRAVNAFWLGGLVLDVLAALLAFLTCRWIERLTEQEQKHLEKVFSRVPEPVEGEEPEERPWKTSWPKWFFYSWLGLSLFVPMPLLILGVVCMLAGIYTYTWTQHSVIVASLITLAGAGPLPFIVGDFVIGRENKQRRRKLITRLSEMQGDW